MNKWNLFLTTIIISSLLGCESVEKWDQTPAGAAATPSTGTTATTGSTTTTTVNETLQDLTLTVDAGTALSYTLHKANDQSAVSGCTIDKDSLDTTPTDATINTVDIDCILEAEELDLFFNDVKFNIEVPSSVCEYITYTPYWFWQYQPGSTTFSYTTMVDSSGLSGAGQAACQTEACTVYDTLATNGNAGSFTTETEFALYNHTRPTNSAPNCDSGSITKTEYTLSWSDANNNGTHDATECSCSDASVTVTDNGGQASNCIAGPGKDFNTTSTGYPVGVIYYANAGLSQSWTHANPYTKALNSNIYAANYSAKTNIHDTQGYGDPTEELDALDTVTEDAGITGTYRSRMSSHSRQSFSSTNNIGPRTDGSQPYYEWECLDKAYNVKGRIRVAIREWDKTYPTTDSSLLGLAIPHDNTDGGTCAGCSKDADADEMMDNIFATDMWGNPWDNKSDWDNFALKRFAVQCNQAGIANADTLTIGSYTFTVATAAHASGEIIVGTSSSAASINNFTAGAGGTNTTMCAYLYSAFTNKTALKYPVMRSFMSTYDVYHSSTPTAGTWDAASTLNDSEVLYVVPKYRWMTDATDYNSATDSVYHVTKAATKKPAVAATTHITEVGTTFGTIHVIEAPIYNEKEATAADQHTGGRAYAFPGSSL